MSLETHNLSDTSSCPPNYPPELISVIHKACDETRKTVDFHETIEAIQALKFVRIYIAGVQVTLEHLEKNGRQARYTLRVDKDSMTLGANQKDFFLRVILNYPHSCQIGERNNYRAVNSFMEGNLAKYFSKQHGAGVAFVGSAGMTSGERQHYTDQENIYYQKGGIVIERSTDGMMLLCRDGDAILGQCRVLEIDMRVVRDLKSETIIKNSHSENQLAKLGVKVVRKDRKFVLKRIES